MKRALLAVSLILLIVIVSGWVQAQAGYLRVPEDLVIEFRGTANVVNRDIMFTDIASVASSDREFAKALGQVNLGPAPSAGYTRKLTSGYIELRLRQRRINPSSLPVDIPDSVLITSETVVLPSTSIVLEARRFVEDKFGVESVAGLSAGYVPDLVVPLGQQLMGCVLIGGSPEEGHLAVGTSVSVDGHPAGFVRVEFRDPAFTAIQDPIVVGQTGEVSKSTETIPSASPLPVLPPQTESSPYLVQRGDLVCVSVRTAFAEITAVGEARGNGRLGDVIEVRNVDTGKRFYGRVVSTGVVEVDVSG